MHYKAIGEICDAITAFAAVVGAQKKTDTLRKFPGALVDKMDTAFGDKLQAALSIGDKHTRGAAVAAVESEITKTFSSPLSIERDMQVEKALSNDEDKLEIEKDAGTPLLPVEIADDSVALEPVSGFDEEALEAEASELKAKGALLGSSGLVTAMAQQRGQDPIDVKIAIKKLLVRRLRHMILSTGIRSDGRGVEDVRPIDIGDQKPLLESNRHPLDILTLSLYCR